MAGFALFFVFMLYGEFVFSVRFQDKTIEYVSVIAGTFVAAWGGGWAAFTAERRTRENAERKARISAANKALFVIATMHTVFDNLRRFYIDKDDMRKNPDRALLMDSPQPGMMQKLHFDFDSLSYFLDSEGDVCSMALMDLQVMDWHFQLVVNTAELRAKAVDDMHKAMGNMANLSFTANTAGTLAPMEYIKCSALTDQLIRLVDEGIGIAKEMYRKMQAALQEQFPGQDFVEVKFAEKPA